MRFMTGLSGIAASFGTLWGAGMAFAQDGGLMGRPVNGATGFQVAATEVARDVHSLDFFLLVIITVITLLVTCLLAFVLFRFHEKRNKVPATFTHNSPLEVAWTIVPIVVLVFIGAFSLPVLFKQEEIPAADITVKVTGNQWYWSYEYPDEGIEFDSFLIGDGKVMSPEVEAELVDAGYTKEDFLLATDTAMVVPVNKTIVVQLTGADVIHAWMVPAFGVQASAVPGRLSNLWFKAEHEGTYFGQCTTLCGKDHAYMPITVKVVSEAAYAEWLASEKTAELSGAAAVKVAAAN
ncbi:cytochrome c oxidase subunit II [Pseudorhodobacter sp.]|jgi:cytochrome c oxidase subunit 2|uniref:cytochrome c oxidase subunit II n=1 Tax=Pseudorhodobacter sp. TaxID=1934400 RepID=UPI0039E2EEDE